MPVNANSIPKGVRDLLDAPNYVHLTTLRADGSPRNHVVWVWLRGDQVLICTGEESRKAKDMVRDPRVALSVVDLEDPYRMASLRGHVVEILPDDGLALMDRISIKYTSEPFPTRQSGLVYFVIEIDSAYQRTLDGFIHKPSNAGTSDS